MTYVLTVDSKVHHTPVEQKVVWHSLLFSVWKREKVFCGSFSSRAGHSNRRHPHHHYHTGNCSFRDALMETTPRTELDMVILEWVAFLCVCVCVRHPSHSISFALVFMLLPLYPPSQVDMVSCWWLPCQQPVFVLIFFLLVFSLRKNIQKPDIHHPPLAAVHHCSWNGIRFTAANTHFITYLALTFTGHFIEKHLSYVYIHLKHLNWTHIYWPCLCTL